MKKSDQMSILYDMNSTVEKNPRSVIPQEQARAMRICGLTAIWSEITSVFVNLDGPAIESEILCPNSLRTGKATGEVLFKQPVEVGNDVVALGRLFDLYGHQTERDE